MAKQLVKFTCHYSDGTREDMTVGTPRPVEPFGVGLSLDFNEYFSTDGRWANAFRSFAGGGDALNPGWGRAGNRPEPSKPWEPAPGLQLSPQGYPLSDAAAHSRMEGYAPGDYRFTRAGSGAVSFGGRLQEVSPGVVRLAPAAGQAIIAVRGITPADPPRDFVLQAPDADAGAVYRRPFLDAHKNFGVVRLNPDTMRTNRVPVGARVAPEHWNQTSNRGVAYELLAALAAEAKVSLWIGVPDWADDAHAEAMARVFLAKLPAGKKLYVEPANEPWNPDFDQWQRIHDASQTNPELTATNENEKHWQQNAWLARRFGLIFRRVARELGRPEWDVRPVLGVQSSTTETTRVGLSFLADRYGCRPGDYLWSVGTTGYYRLPESVKSAIDAAPSDPAGLDLLFAYYLHPTTGILVTEQQRRSLHTGIAALHGVIVDVYECSAPELVDHGKPETDRSARVADLAQDDPRIAQCVRLDLDACRALYDAGVAVWYKGVGPREKEGRYSLAPAIDKLAGPKWTAAVEYARNQPRRTAPPA